MKRLTSLVMFLALLPCLAWGQAYYVPSLTNPGTIGSTTPATGIYGAIYYFTDDNGNAIIKNNNGEGIANGSELRIGLEEASRIAILCDVGDIDTDFGLAAATDPTLYIAGATVGDYLKLSANTISAKYSLVGYGNSGFQWITSSDVASGDNFKIYSNPNIELTDADGQQSWVSVLPKINQTGTAAYDAVYANVTETSLGTGATGDGNNLFRGAVAGTTKFKVTNAGEIVSRTNEDVEAASDTLSTDQVYGGVINNYAQAADATMVIPACAKGMNFTVALATTVAKYYRLDPNASDLITLDGVASTDGKYVGIASATTGACIQFVALQTGAAEWNWFAYTICGAWAAE